MNGTFKNYQACIGHICRQLGAQVQYGKIELAARIQFEMNIQQITAPRERAVEVLSYLKSNGCKTGLISDCSTEATLIWKYSLLSSLIDVAVFSCLVGIKKPDPRIYQIAVEKLGVTPKECLYVADGIGQELSSASKLGMLAIQVRVPNEVDYDPYREK